MSPEASRPILGVAIFEKDLEKFPHAAAHAAGMSELVDTMFAYQA
jgi:hypothetical protein